MSNPHSPAPLRESDYDAIEAAVMETEKGRWFLAEYARRHRTADTGIVLDAIKGLERMLHRERRPDVDRIRLDIGEMKDAIERTKLEIAQIKHDAATRISKFDSASNELDAIVTQTEAATSEILGAAEKIQEIVWTMREAGADVEICDQLEELVMTMYTSCSFQDLTGQRTQKVVHVLRYLESRIDAMIEIWGMESAEVERTATSTPDRGPVLDTRPDAHLLNGPQLDGEGVNQDHVDDMFGQDHAADVFDNDVSFEDLDVGEAADAPAAEHLALPAPDEGSDDWTNADAFEPVPAQTDLADTEPAKPEVAEPEPAQPDATDDAVFALAAEAMEEAIGTLKGVSAAVSRPLPVKVEDDPFERISKAERQSLLS